MTKRKATPLQDWRATYKWVAGRIREQRNNTVNGHDWGSFKKKKRAISRLAFLRDQARLLMNERPLAAEATHLKWLADNDDRLGHNSKVMED